MKQPELGKKIAELRKAKGLTQEELVSKCKVTVRTLQRIESGLVTPRSYTLKLIFAALDYNIYNLSENTLVERVFTFFRDKTEQLFKYVIDLFNLKTNTMKKISILSVTAIILSFSLFFLCSESNAQKSNESKFTSSNGRGIIYQFPRGLKIQISNTLDTANYKIGRHLIQEYKYNIFLNKKFVGRTLEGDTVVLNNGKIAIRKSYWKFISPNGKGIIYLFPNNLTMNYSVKKDTDNLFLGDFHIKEFKYKIFFNETYIGTVNERDTVILNKGFLTISKAL